MPDIVLGTEHSKVMTALLGAPTSLGKGLRQETSHQICKVISHRCGRCQSEHTTAPPTPLSSAPGPLHLLLPGAGDAGRDPRGTARSLGFIPIPEGSLRWGHTITSLMFLKEPSFQTIGRKSESRKTRGEEAPMAFTISNFRNN